MMDLEFDFEAEAAPTRVRIEERRTPDGVVKWWTESEADALDAIVGSSVEETTARVLARINAPLGAKA